MYQITEASRPTKVKGISYSPGHVYPFGATVLSFDSINFSICSKDATSCTLVLFKNGQKKPLVEIPFTDDCKIGSNYSMIVHGVNYEDIEYGYRFDGPNNFKEGLVFDPSKLLIDPYSRLVSGHEIWGKETSKYGLRSKVALEDYLWNGDNPLETPIEDLVIYELHVRGYTMSASSDVKKKGTYYGLIEKIPYLKELGVNCVELMPIFEFNELENGKEYNGQRLYNYWGYSTACFMAPKAGYSSVGALGMTIDEVKNMIKQFHSNGIEIILDVVFNHTAEGNEYGPYISYRGIDNKTYYLLTPDGYYYNFSGCGNTINCNSPVVRDHILDILRYWVREYHIDGFRFDLASILSRDVNGMPMSNPPLLESLANDLVLSKTKLIAEAWDADGMYQVGSFPNWGKWAEWNGRYRDCVRNFVRSDANAGPEVLLRLQGSPDMYYGRGASASINFVTCHDGFTLNDLVSYNSKHNEANGEDNRDGCNDNNSWNCGIEGPTDDKYINALRKRQIKNAASILLLSRGVPMLLAGDEFGNSQNGNNNVYCQDSELSYVNWDNLDNNRDVFEYFRELIKLRKAHPVLRRGDFYTAHNQTGYPEMSFHSTTPWANDVSSPQLTFGVMYAESALDYNLKKDTFIYFAYNSYWEDVTFKLPMLPEGMSWTVYLYSADNADNTVNDNRISLISRSSMILISK